MEKPADLSYFEADHALLAVAASAWGLNFDGRIYPFLIDRERCFLLEVRSRTSRKWVLRADGTAYFLKQVPWYAASLEQVKTICAAQDLVARRTGLALAPIPTGDGELFARIGPDYFYLTLVENETVTADPEHHAASAATALAEIHDLDVSLPHARRQEYFDLVDQLLGIARVRFANNADSIVYMDFLAERLAEAHASALRLPPPRLVLVHGDFSPWNILVQPENGALKIIDFDNCDLGPGQRDLAELVLTQAGLIYNGDTTNLAHPFRLEPAPERARTIVSAYATARSAGWRLQELELLQPMLEMVLVEYLALGLLRDDFCPLGDLAATRRAFADLEKLMPAPGTIQ